MKGRCHASPGLRKRNLSSYAPGWLSCVDLGLDSEAGFAAGFTAGFGAGFAEGFAVACVASRADTFDLLLSAGALVLAVGFAEVLAAAPVVLLLSTSDFCAPLPCVFDVCVPFPVWIPFVSPCFPGTAAGSGFASTLFCTTGGSFGLTISTCLL